MMAEPMVSLYNTWAHVFQINPETKNSWLPKGDAAIPISFLINEPQTNRRELRLIGSGDNGDTVLDSVISPRTVFAKRSQKFCQYCDTNGIIWGLGFNCEAELNEFIETFQQLQRDLMASDSVAASMPPVVNQESQPHMNLRRASLSSETPGPAVAASGSAAAVAAASSAQAADRVGGWIKAQPSVNNTSEMNSHDFNTSTVKSFDRYSESMGGAMAAATQYNNTQPRNQQVRRQQMSTNDASEHDSINNNGLNGNGNGNDHEAHYPRSQSMFGMQQKQTSGGIRASDPVDEDGILSNLKIKDQLRYENDRLKQALEESSKNAGIWQNELINLRTNNAKLTQALQESKAHVGEWEKELRSLRDENKELKLRVKSLESSDDPEKSSEYKNELEKYKHYMDEVQKELGRKESEIENLQQAMEKLEVKASANGLQNGGSDDPTSVDVAISFYQKQKFDTINAKLEAKISELQNIQTEYAQLADKLYH